MKKEKTEKEEGKVLIKLQEHDPFPFLAKALQWAQEKHIMKKQMEYGIIF